MDQILDKIINKREEPKDEISLVVIYRNSETLASFKEQFITNNYNNDGTTDNVESVKSGFLSSRHIIFQGDIPINLYFCLCDDMGINCISLVKPLLSNANNIHWLILLDWSIYDQQLWLEHTDNCLKEIGNEGPRRTVLAINSEHIYEIQKDIPLWYSYHIDYIQQALRWYCLQNGNGSQGCDIIYTESKEEELGMLFKKLLTNRFTKEDIEMAQTTKLLIPTGHDKLSLIKALDDTFNEKQCTLQKFKEVVPAPTKLELSLESLTSQRQYFVVPADDDPIKESNSLNEQEQLKQLLDYSKTLNR